MASSLRSTAAASTFAVNLYLPVRSRLNEVLVASCCRSVFMLMPTLFKLGCQAAHVGIGSLRQFFDRGIDLRLRLP